MRFKVILVCSLMRHTRKYLESEIMGFMSQSRALHRELTNLTFFAQLHKARFYTKPLITVNISYGGLSSISLIPRLAVNIILLNPSAKL